MNMILFILALSLLGICQVAADSKYKSIVPKLVRAGEPYVIYCDANLAGASEKNPGVESLKLTYKSYYASIDLKGFYKYLPDGWVGFHEGMYNEKNDANLYKITAIRIKVIVPQATESVHVCCSCTYDIRSTTHMCQEMEVSNKAIVDHSTPGVGNTVNILCQADLVLENYATELDYIKLAWKNDAIRPYSFIASSMKALEPNLTVAAHKPHWSFTHAGTDVNSNKRFDLNRATLGITISKIEYGDSGFFCCGVIYYDQEKWRNNRERCQYLHVASCDVMPEIENGFWIQPCDVEDGCYFRCRDGFVLNGLDSASCVTQGSVSYWTDHGQCVNASLCEKPPSIAKGTLRSPCFPIVGSVCYLACDEGYIVNGAESITCNKMPKITYQWIPHTNQWTSPGECIPTASTCGELPPLAFGKWEPSCYKTVGSVCHPVCDKGYIVHGATEVTCNEQLQWSISGICDFQLKSITTPNVIEGKTFYVDCNADLAGVQTSVLGINKLEIVWRNGKGDLEVNGYHTYESTYYRGRKAKPHWLFTKEGTQLMNNEPRWFDGRQFKIRITIKESQMTDSGRFCCECIYYDSQKQLQASTRCQAVLVGKKTILDQSSARNGNPVLVVCDADLAGVPRETKGLEYLEVTWRNESHHQTPLSVFKEYVNIIEATHTTRNIILPSSEHSWSINSTMARLHPNTLNIDRNSVRVEVLIGDFKTTDVGIFCCSAVYMDMLDDGQLTYGCQSLSKGFEFSTNGFSNVQASDYLVFILITGIIKMHV